MRPSSCSPASRCAPATAARWSWRSIRPRPAAPALIARIAAAHAVDDIHVEQPAIEEVIARFYDRHGAGEA